MHTHSRCRKMNENNEVARRITGASRRPLTPISQSGCCSDSTAQSSHFETVAIAICFDNKIRFTKCRPVWFRARKLRLIERLLQQHILCQLIFFGFLKVFVNDQIVANGPQS